MDTCPDHHSNYADQIFSRVRPLGSGLTFLPTDQNGPGSIPGSIIHGLWNPEVQCHIHEGSTVIPILSLMNPISRINTYFFKAHSNLRLGLPKDLFPIGLYVKILKALLPPSILTA